MDNEQDKLSKVSNSKSLLSYTSTWSDHSVMKVLISSFSGAVKLLDEFDSKLDLSQYISSYPIPPFSSDMIPSDTSTNTVLAIRYDQELYKCTLQCVYDVRSVMVEKCDITQHCLQLLAVRSTPTTFYWTIPKSVVSIVSNKVQEHSDCLYHNNILEVLFYPGPLLTTGHYARIGSLAFNVEVENSASSYEVLNIRMYTVYFMIMYIQYCQEVTLHSRTVDARVANFRPAISLACVCQLTHHM